MRTEEPFITILIVVITILELRRLAMVLFYIFRVLLYDIL